MFPRMFYDMMIPVNSYTAEVWQVVNRVTQFYFQSPDSGVHKSEHVVSMTFRNVHTLHSQLIFNETLPHDDTSLLKCQFDLQSLRWSLNREMSINNISKCPKCIYRGIFLHHIEGMLIRHITDWISDIYIHIPVLIAVVQWHSYLYCNDSWIINIACRNFYHKKII